MSLINVGSQSGMIFVVRITEQTSQRPCLIAVDISIVDFQVVFIVIRFVAKAAMKLSPGGGQME